MVIKKVAENYYKVDISNTPAKMNMAKDRVSLQHYAHNSQDRSVLSHAKILLQRHHPMRSCDTDRFFLFTKNVLPVAFSFSGSLR